MKLSSVLFPLSVAAGGILTTSYIPSATAQTAVSPQSMKVLGEVDPRFVSYNVEAVEVTGGALLGTIQICGAEGCRRWLQHAFRQSACRSG